MWGTPGTPLTERGPFPSHLVGAKTKAHVERALNKAVFDTRNVQSDKPETVRPPAPGCNVAADATAERNPFTDDPEALAVSKSVMGVI